MSYAPITIINDDDQAYLSLPLPGSEGVYFKVLKADELARRAALKICFT